MGKLFGMSDTPDQRAFHLFYDTYAPIVWGLIVKANLPASQAEAIFINTFVKVWQQRDEQAPGESLSITRLVGLACKEGLPIEALQSILKPKP